MLCLESDLHGFKADPSARANDQDCRHGALAQKALAVRISRGVFPVQRLHACVNALTSVKPSIHAILDNFSIAHHRSGGTSEMARFVGTKVEFGADRDVQLAIVEVTNRQIASQLLKYFSEVQAHVRKPSCKRVRSPGARSRSVGRE